MKILGSDEQLLKGSWNIVSGEIVSDRVCDRIEHLTKFHLSRLAESKEFGAWEVLFKDPKDGRLWELTYPQGDQHGGGPPQLSVIGENLARIKYDF
jgi:hypothetical protein